MNRIEYISERTKPQRDQIIDHAVYSAIRDIEDLQIFMKFHVYAVWDFMSLLKSVQNKLTCVDVPWHPIGSANTRYLINEIVAGEESDIDLHDCRKSHYEMYLDAMKQCDADTLNIKAFTKALQEGSSFDQAYTMAKTPMAAKAFVNFTFEVINSGKTHVQSAVFTFGREDLIPKMFLSIVSDLNEQFPNKISYLKYYLDRHIAVDGDHHSHLALEMTSELCADNEKYWEEAEDACQKSLEQRIKLWDGALAEIRSLKKYGPAHCSSQQNHDSAIN